MQALELLQRGRYTDLNETDAEVILQDVEANANPNADNNLISLDVCSLSYYVSLQDRHAGGMKQKQLLNDVSFNVHQGDMVALLGPSGAGKSTLLDLLADRVSDGYFAGDIYINKQQRSPNFQREVCYAQQIDYHMATLTVWETIRYSCMTQMPSTTTPSQLDERVEYLLEMLKLSNIKNSFVGDAKAKGISGGQLKRVTIAVEMALLPSIIFLDEPTSGLDYTTSLQVMEIFSNLVQQNRLCISTIHQPNVELFSLFNKVALLAKGHLIFYGPPKDVVTYFTSKLPMQFLPPAVGTSPQDFCLLVATQRATLKDSNEEVSNAILASAFQNTEYVFKWSVTDYENASENKQSGTTSVLALASVDDKYAIFNRQLYMLLHRGMKDLSRDHQVIASNLLLNLGLGLLVGSIVINQGNELSDPVYVAAYGYPPTATFSVLSSFFWLLNMGMANCLVGIPEYKSKRVLNLRELKAGSYSATVCWLGTMLMQIPLDLLGLFVMYIPYFFLVGYPIRADFFFFFFLCMAMYHYWFHFMSILCVSMTNSEVIAGNLLNAIYVLSLCFSGFSPTLPNIPIYWRWMTYINPGFYAFKGMCIVYFRGYSTEQGDILVDYLGYKEDGGIVKNPMLVIPILIAFIIVTTLLIYYTMLPSTKTLIKLDKSTEKSLEQSTGGAYTAVVKGAREGDAAVTLRGRGRNDVLSKMWDYFTHFLIQSLSHRTRGISMSKKGAVASMKAQVQDGHEREAILHEDDGDGEAHLTVDHFRSKTKEGDALTEADSVTMSFQNVSYTVDTRNGKLPLLNNVSGIFQPNEICVLAGASGAGKSTLLDVLAGRTTSGHIKGSILFNGISENVENSLKYHAIARDAAYVTQDNVHFESLTVRQTVRYAAEFRLGEELSTEEKNGRVEDLLQLFGLLEHAESIVGGVHYKGLSGGQIKRLSIAVECIHKPALVYLDEPTTGLDAVVSLDLMNSIRNLADCGRTILCTIHQPSSLMCSMFDKIFLMADGQPIFCGPYDQAVPYFRDSVHAFPFATGRNSFDYLIDIASGNTKDINDTTVSKETLIDMFAKSDTNSALLTAIRDHTATASSRSSQSTASEGLSGKSVQFVLSVHSILTEFHLEWIESERFGKTSLWQQVRTLFHRELVLSMNDLPNTFCLVVSFFLAGLFAGSLWYKFAEKGSVYLYDSVFALWWFLVMVEYVIQTKLPAVFERRLLFYRERGAHAVSPLAFNLVHTLFEFVKILVEVMAFVLPFYYLLGMRSGGFGFFYLVAVFDAMTAYLLFRVVETLTPDLATLYNYTTLILFWMWMLSGASFPIDSLHNWISWAPDVNQARWVLQSYLSNEYEGNTDIVQDIFGAQISSKKWQDFGYLLCFSVVFFVSWLFLTKYTTWESR